MSVLAPGSEVPDFRLTTEDGETFTRDDLAGKTTVLVFYPAAFSSVCTNQFQIYEEVLEDFGDAKLYGVSTDATFAQSAFVEKLGVSIEQLSDFEPKGETARKLGAYFEPGGMTNRAIVIFGPDGVVKSSYLGENPGVLPGADVIIDGLEP